MNKTTTQLAQIKKTQGKAFRGGASKGWREVKLGEVAKIITGKTPPTKKQELFGSKYPFITPTDISENSRFCSTKRFLSEKGKEFQNNLLLPKDTICYTCIASIGKICITTQESFTNQQINSVIVDDKKTTYNFLFYFLKYTTLDIQNMAGGTTTGIVNKTQFSKTKILLPPLPEQKAIAEVLSSLDDKIDLLHRQNKTLEDMAQALFRKWFIDEADARWEEKPLSYFGDVICGKTPSKKIYDYFGGNIPFIKIPDMHSKTFIFETADSLTDKGKNSQKNKTLPLKSICVSCIATVGLVSMNAFESQTNQQINSIIPKKDEFRYFVYLFMKSSKDLLEAMASGSTATMNLNTGNFSNIMLPKIDEKLLLDFHHRVEPIFNKIFFNQSQIRTLENLRDTLLPKLMSGVVRVRF